MNEVGENVSTRMATEVMQDAKRRMQARFVHQVCDDLLDGVRTYPRVPGELPEHDIVMTSEGPDAMLERFKREPDMLTIFLPEGFAVVDRATLEQHMKLLSDAIPLYTESAGKFLGSASGRDHAEMVLRKSANKLFGMAEGARRRHEDAERT